jgi:hypothetical protein
MTQIFGNPLLARNLQGTNSNARAKVRVNLNKFIVYTI